MRHLCIYVGGPHRLDPLRTVMTSVKYPLMVKIHTQMQGGLQIKSTRQMLVWQFIYQCNNFQIWFWWKFQITDDLYICQFLLHRFKTRNICVRITNMFTNIIFICEFFFYLYMDWNIFVCALKMHLCIESYIYIYIYTTPQIHLWVLFRAFIPLCVHLSIMRLFWLHMWELKPEEVFVTVDPVFGSRGDDEM